jgi:hypothetical protein
MLSSIIAQHVAQQVAQHVVWPGSPESAVVSIPYVVHDTEFASNSTSVDAGGCSSLKRHEYITLILSRRRCCH